MRIWPPVLFALVAGVAFVGLLGAPGCSEETPTAKTDQDAPYDVAIENPVAVGVYGATIEDTTTVVVRARDDQAIRTVEIMYILHDDPHPRRLTAQADYAGEHRYTFFWRTEAIPNGATGALYALATDEAGNQRVSEKILIRIINNSQVGAPTADFVITPSEGTVNTEFILDPTVTNDPLSELVDLPVRWDFEGDGIWDVDTTSGANASQVIRHVFPVPGQYNVTLWVYNRYYSIENDDPGKKVRALTVRPAFGDPRPPAGQELVRIPEGIYPFAALQCPECGDEQGDQDETLADTLLVRISNAYWIDKREVTNRLYAGFLNAATDSATITYDDVLGEVRGNGSGRVLLVLDPSLTRVKYQVVDSTFYVDEAFAEHPVTGVTWEGALSYASFYGLRLPTEVEWEIAARGQSIVRGYFYPWTPNRTIDGSYANFRGSGDPFEQVGVTLSTTPVGAYNGTSMQGFPTTLAESPFGTYDQAGNVAEWVKDCYATDTYALLYEAYARFLSPPIDPQGPDGCTEGVDRVLRGGSFVGWDKELRVTNRQGASPDRKAPWIGFRTAYTEF
jgi:formylglycine-generating enzyme required for sulfatase activity